MSLQSVLLEHACFRQMKKGFIEVLVRWRLHDGRALSSTS